MLKLATEVLALVRYKIEHADFTLPLRFIFSMELGEEAEHVVCRRINFRKFNCPREFHGKLETC